VTTFSRQLRNITGPIRVGKEKKRKVTDRATHVLRGNYASITLWAKVSARLAENLQIYLTGYNRERIGPAAEILAAGESAET
jgi:hypothetical protein